MDAPEEQRPRSWPETSKFIEAEKKRYKNLMMHIFYACFLTLIAVCGGFVFFNTINFIDDACALDAKASASEFFSKVGMIQPNVIECDKSIHQCEAFFDKRIITLYCSCRDKRCGIIKDVVIK